MEVVMMGHKRWLASQDGAAQAGALRWRVGVMVGVAVLHLSIAMVISDLRSEPVRLQGVATLNVGMLPVASSLRDSHLRPARPVLESTPQHTMTEQPKPVAQRQQGLLTSHATQGEPKLVAARSHKAAATPHREPIAQTAVTTGPATVAPQTASQGVQAAPRSQPRFDADYLDNPRPAYPPFSLRLKEEGRVLLKVLVNRSGHANSVSIAQSSGYARLDNSALETVRHWRFVPAKVGEEPQDSWVIVPINFSLRENV